MEQTENSFDLKKLIKDYIIASDELSEINKEVKQYRDKKKFLENSIKQHMIDSRIGQLDTKNGSIKVSTSKIPVKLNKQIITDLLVNNLDHDKASDMLDELFNTENAEEVTKLEFKKQKN